MIGRRGAAAAAMTAVVLAAGAVQLLPGGAPQARATGLTPYASCDALLAHYRSEAAANGPSGYGYAVDGPVLADASTSAAGAPGAAEGARSTGDAVGSGPTGTNLQEQGVDEPDMAKLRDGRLVVLAHGALRVLSAEAEPEELGSLRVGSAAAYGGELLLAGDRALVVLQGWRQDPRPQDGTDHAGSSRIAGGDWFPGRPTTRVVLADISSDRPRLIERATYDGRYVSARLVDGTVRLVTANSPWLRPVLPPVPPIAGGSSPEQEAQAVEAAHRRAAQSLRLEDVLPQVLRTDAEGTVLERGHAVTCAGTTHARSPRGSSTLLVTTLRPEEGLAATDRTAVTTDGDLVYASENRLYVATSRWGTVAPVRLLDDVGRRGVADAARPAAEVRTEIHAFDTESSRSTRYVATGSVPGYVLGRWALSEHEGTLRVATTRQPPWDGSSAGETSSMVVKLEETGGRLDETGRVAGLGKTEQIKAVRYFGDVAVVVTFRQTDPLYMVDLSGDPEVLGELKVPGFSTYLHPIGDGLLLGLGHDATEEGQVTGMQLSVFDISDLAEPTLVDKLRLGQGYSPALDDSRGFGYDPDRRTAVFPFHGYDMATGAAAPGTGAVGVAVDGDGRLREVGRLEGPSGDGVMRVLTDEEWVYAVGMSSVVAGDAATMDRTGDVVFQAG